jgi:hypothetical protein
MGGLLRVCTLRREGGWWAGGREAGWWEAGRLVESEGPRERAKERKYKRALR